MTLLLRGPTVIRERLASYLQGHIDSGAVRGNAMQLAAMIVGMTFALVVKSSRVDWGDEASPKKIIPAFVDVLLNGVKSE